VNFGPVQPIWTSALTNTYYTAKYQQDTYTKVQYNFMYLGNTRNLPPPKRYIFALNALWGLALSLLPHRSGWCSCTFIWEVLGSNLSRDTGYLYSGLPKFKANAEAVPRLRHGRLVAVQPGFEPRIRTGATHYYKTPRSGWCCVAVEAAAVDVLFSQQVQLSQLHVHVGISFGLACLHVRLKVNPLWEFRVTNADGRSFSQ
jgi:hypothetical protein